MTQRLALDGGVLRLQKLLPTRGVFGRPGCVDLGSLLSLEALETGGYQLVILRDSKGGEVGIAKLAPWPQVEVWGRAILDAADKRGLEVSESARYVLTHRT